jgi:integrase
MTMGELKRRALTVKETYLASLKVVLEVGRENGALRENAAAEVKVRVPKKVRLRDPQFTKEEAQTILRAALQPQNTALSPEHKLARRWVPWLCAYTGARVNEMTQLRAEDVRKVEGVWTLRITPEAGGVKGNKARTVPLHEHMIDQGFIEVVDAKGEGPLFYNPERGRGGKAGNPHYKKVGERLAAWVRDIGVNDPEVQPNHGWRHLFKAIGRRACAPHRRRGVRCAGTPRASGGT